MRALLLILVLIPAHLHAGSPPLDAPAIYSRAKAEFALATFFKPIDPGTKDLTLELGPLILQEIRQGAGPSLGHDIFGSLSLSKGALVLDVSKPTIYVEADTVQIHGKEHARFTYLWCYSVEPKPEPGLVVQGFRQTLSSAGQPVVWEVLADASGAKLIFVSEALENAAAVEFGPPLAGRRFAIEKSQAEAPKVIVPRVIDDAPVPMGPTVYLTAGARSVSTLICRCMPAQAKALSATRSYRLELAPLTSPYSLLARVRERTKPVAAFWPGQQRDDERLERGLRLPRSF